MKPDRVANHWPLQPGAHPNRDGGVCAMEMVAWLAGEEHSDQPRCACPVLGAVVRRLNDTLPDALRDSTLRPLVPRLVNSRGDRNTERRRAWALVDWAVRRAVPARLRAAGRTTDGAALERLTPVMDSTALATAAAWARAVVPDDDRLGWLLKRAGSRDQPEAWIAAAVPRMPSDHTTGLDATTVSLLQLLHDLTTSPAAEKPAAGTPCPSAGARNRFRQ